MSKMRGEWTFRLYSFLIWGLVQILAHASRLRVVGYENVQRLIDRDQGFILAIWHGRTLLPIHYCRGMGIWAITSLSKDGELQTRVVERFGYRTIRGSSARGGIKAALSAAKKLENGGILAITPDGPKGPVHQVQEGAVFLAQRANVPIVPIGVDMRWRKLLGSWDSYAIPLPFTRAAIVFGQPIYPSQAEPDTTSPEEALKAALDAVQQQAKSMANEGS